jgi:hypothetical protein
MHLQFCIKNKTTAVDGGFAKHIIIYYKLAGNKILKSPKLYPLKLEP